MLSHRTTIYTATTNANEPLPSTTRTTTTTIFKPQSCTKVQDGLFSVLRSIGIIERGVASSKSVKGDYTPIYSGKGKSRANQPLQGGENENGGPPNNPDRERAGDNNGHGGESKAVATNDRRDTPIRDLRRPASIGDSGLIMCSCPRCQPEPLDDQSCKLETETRELLASVSKSKSDSDSMMDNEGGAWVLPE